MTTTQIFYMPGTLRQISRSHVISRFRPDLLPSLHKVTQMRHNFRQKNSDIVTFRAPGWRLCPFLYARNLGDPLNCWKVQKTASKLVSYCQEGDTNTKIWSPRGLELSFFLFERHFKAQSYGSNI